MLGPLGETLNPNEVTKFGRIRSPASTMTQMVGDGLGGLLIRVLGFGGVVESWCHDCAGLACSCFQG